MKVRTGLPQSVFPRGGQRGGGVSEPVRWRVVATHLTTLLPETIDVSLCFGVVSGW